MIPHHCENGVFVFLKSYCDMYGMPYLYGYDSYIVIDDVIEYVMDYKMTIERKLRPIHRYSRKDRFIFILSQLLGLRGHVDREIVDSCKGCKTWDEIRTVLKSQNKSKLYNRIPFIMKRLGLPNPVTMNITNEIFREIVDEFVVIQGRLELGTRKYFPSLRYIAIKLIEQYGGKVDFKYIRTKRKRSCLDNLWLSVT